jgi:CubicO group peptidase (beta-lactamase class C family)
LNPVKRALAALALASIVAADRSVAQVPALTAESSAGFAPIASLVEAAIARHELPGAVVMIGRGDTIAYRRAFGQRALLPSPEPMTDDTIFDLASLTKVVATTTSVMKLVEEGRIRLGDPVARFIPDFGRYGKSGIAVRHLLTHTSGLRPDLELELEFHGADEAIRRAIEEVPVAPPGERFVYSDINFFLLGDIVRRVSGERLDGYAKAQIFDPLGMNDTTFLPPEAWRSRIAPTERCRMLAWPCVGPGDGDVPFLRGVVHDPTARRMDGVAGHAGLFSTAADLSRFCRMLLGGGRLGTVRILSPATVARMTSPATPPDMRSVRGLGWDVDSSYSANRGELFPIGSFGHTGFTGTSLWLDPGTKSFVIFLSSRVHPDGKGDVTALRGKVATVAAAALMSADDVERSAKAFALRQPGARELQPRLQPSGQGPTLAGIDVLAAEGFARLRGKRVGLLTNHTGRSRQGESTIDLLAHAQGVTLVALFSPEHGIRGQLDDKVPSSRDEKTGLAIHSLYADTRRPTDAMLEGIDTLVIDLQDIGARFYTYPATVAYAMEEAARRHVAVVVLDRPNPIDGFDVEGPVQDEAAIGFTGYLPMPIRHGLTIGELARLFNGERKIGADLTVVPMKNWRRDEHLGRSRHGYAVRAARCAVDRWPGARRRAQRERAAGRPLLSAHIHTGGWRDARRPAMPGGVPHRDRSRSHQAGARRPRDRGVVIATARSTVQARGRRAVVRVEIDD